MKILHVIINSKWHNVIMNETLPKDLHPLMKNSTSNLQLFLLSLQPPCTNHSP